MAGLVGSFDRDKFIELMNLNQEMGNFSYSVMVFRPNAGVVSVRRETGYFDGVHVPKKEDAEYYLGHVSEAVPGSGRGKDWVQPSEINKSYLYHAGRLEPGELDRLQEIAGSRNDWDTGLLHEALLARGFDCLNNLAGTFACLYINKWNIYAFSSDFMELHLDENMNLSSRKFGRNVQVVQSRKVYQVRFDTNRLFFYAPFTPPGKTPPPEV